MRERAATGKARSETAKKRVSYTRLKVVLINDKYSTVLTFVLVLLIIALTVWLVHDGKETAGLLAVVTALVPVLTLLLRPKKDDDTDDAD